MKALASNNPYDIDGGGGYVISNNGGTNSPPVIDYPATQFPKPPNDMLPPNWRPPQGDPADPFGNAPKIIGKLFTNPIDTGVGNMSTGGHSLGSNKNYSPNIYDTDRKQNTPTQPIQTKKGFDKKTLVIFAVIIIAVYYFFFR
jgi:hypothetical protein